jgi:hypothetical protein
MLIRNLVLGIAVVGLVAPAQAQSLVDLAKQEKARRAALKAKGKTGKSYTEGDTSGNAGNPVADATVPGAAAGGGGSTPAGEAPKTPDQVRADQQKEWADRLKAAQDEIKAAEEVLAQNERSLASITQMTPARADLASRVDSDRKKVADLKAKIDQLEEERRRSGFKR